MHRPPTKSITHFAILSLAAYAFWGCQKEFSIEDASIFTKVPETREEQVNIQGIVLDDAGKPLAGADVRAGYQTLRTDRYGIFRFERVPINANGGLVTVQKEGYFMGSRSMLYEKETTNFMRIRLVKKSWQAPSTRPKEVNWPSEKPASTFPPTPSPSKEAPPPIHAPSKYMPPSCPATTSRSSMKCPVTSMASEAIAASQDWKRSG